MASNAQYTAVVDIDPFEENTESQLEFQNFVLNSAEANLTTNAKAGTPSSNALPTSYTSPTPPPLLRQQSTSAFWRWEFYQQFFNVDSDDVRRRITDSLLPTTSTTFLETVKDNPDLYGPFWVPTTVIFLLFVTSTMAGSIVAYINGDKGHDFNVALLPLAVSCVYSFVVVVPGLVWGLGRYFASPAPFLDLLNLYGYGMAVWVPVSVLCVLPSELLRWVLIVAAFGLSTSVFLRSIIPLFAVSSNAAAARTAAMAVVVVSNAVLALVFRYGFFKYVAEVNGKE